MDRVVCVVCARVSSMSPFSLRDGFNRKSSYQRGSKQHPLNIVWCAATTSCRDVAKTAGAHQVDSLRKTMFFLPSVCSCFRELLLVRPEFAPRKERLELIQAGLIHDVHEAEVHDGKVHNRAAGGDRPVLLALLVDALAHLPRGHELISHLDSLLLCFRKGACFKKGSVGARLVVVVVPTYKCNFADKTNLKRRRARPGTKIREFINLGVWPHHGIAPLSRWHPFRKSVCDKNVLENRAD